ncbi:uncharacterized protein C8A04DRAFT_32419 [Dichotomopilus funicola]|uniref:Uncharacterized protein n=1 Tax=Dichotomopilus funicola TaxID=1934379 RepID=A0AAN6ZIV2_9PEZI|nr:hypothetical protein C8A04DRAFT_32419 [Dichotomopilus funicola]
MPPVINPKTNTLAEAVKAALTKKSGDSKDGQKRREPWRDMERYKSTEDNVQVSKVCDMRLFGNHVNAHS